MYQWMKMDQHGSAHRPLGCLWGALNDDDDDGYDYDDE